MVSSLKINTVFNAIGQIYSMLMGFIMTPVFIRYLGAEAFGLVSFFTLLTAWMNLLDLGMAPTLVREVGTSRFSPVKMGEFAKLLRSFEVIFLGISVSIICLFYILRDWISEDWIKSSEVPLQEISKSIMIMGVLIAFRWFSSLYRSVLIGLEKHVDLNLINILFSTLKFAGVLLLFMYWSSNIYVFFMYQLFFGFLELVFIGIYTYRKLPKEVFSLPIFSFYWSNVRGIIPFALSIAYTSSVWIFVSQVDKLVLSGVLNLKEYGYFSLAISLSGIIYAIGVPITQSITPRMISLYSVKDVSRLLKLYRYSTQIITLVALSVAIVISLFAKEIIFVWTGDIQAAEWSKDILFWYSLGNATLVISGVQYFLQVAYGQLRFHVLGGTLTLFIDVPIIILISLNFGAHSASIAWFLIRLFWLIVWTPIINFKFAPGLHAKWFFNDVLLIIVVVVLSALSLKSVFSIQSNNRHELIFHVFIFGFTLVIISSFSSSFVRLKFLSLIRTLLKLNLSKLNF